MAIAPLELDPDYESLEPPWPRPVLRSVPAGDGWEDEDDWDDGDGGVPEREERLPEGPDPDAARLQVVGAPVLRRGAGLSAYRRRRAALRRRRAIAVGILAVVTVIGLALPLQALGGRPAVAHPVGPRIGDVTYVVQPGDTEWSIAERFDSGGDPRVLATAIARETGSDVVAPGERIAVP